MKPTHGSHIMTTPNGRHVKIDFRGRRPSKPAEWEHRTGDRYDEFVITLDNGEKVVVPGERRPHAAPIRVRQPPLGQRKPKGNGRGYVAAGQQPGFGPSPPPGVDD